MRIYVPSTAYTVPVPNDLCFMISPTDTGIGSGFGGGATLGMGLSCFCGVAGFGGLLTGVEPVG